MPKFFALGSPTLLALATLAAGYLPLTSFAQESVRLGQIVPLSGPLANVGKEIAAATKAALDQHNRSHKPQIELILEDDGNDAVRSAQAVGKLGGKVSSLLSCFGTVSCMAQMQAAQPLALPLIGPIAGAAALRSSKAPYVFSVRASATEELKKLLQYSQSNGLTRWGVAIQDDGFGQAYWTELKTLLVGFDVRATSFVLIKPQAPDYAAAVAQLNQPTTQVLLLLANSTHSVGLLNTWRTQSPLPFVMNLSGQANGLFANGLKGYAGAAAFVTATPSPWDKKLALQRNYQAAMQEANITNWSYLGFEAYINARLAIDAVKRSKTRSPAGMKTSLESAVFDLGGMEIGFGSKSVGRFTDLSLLKPDGTFKH